MTPFTAKLLKALSERSNQPAKAIAERVWPKLNTPIVSVRAGQWQCAGAHLSKLVKIGLAEKTITDHAQKLFSITPKGLMTLENWENV